LDSVWAVFELKNGSSKLGLKMKKMSLVNQGLDRTNRRISILLLATSAIVIIPGLQVHAQVYDTFGSYSMTEALTTDRYTTVGNVSLAAISGQSAKSYPNVSVGEFTLTFTSGTTPPPGYGNSFAAYCVDLYQYSTDFTAQARSFPSTALQENPYWQANGGKMAAYLYNSFASQVNTMNEGAALQLSIWQAVYGNAFTFSASPEITALVTGESGYYHLGVENNWGQNSSGVFPYQTTWWHSLNPDTTYGQDMIGPPLAVPEPADAAWAALIVLGLACVHQTYRRKSRNDKA
jgi:hypothetical protein